MEQRAKGSSGSAQGSLEYSIYELLKRHGIAMTTAESATGGMIASTLVNVPGISSFFQEGYVTYSDTAKVKMLGVNAGTIRRYGVVSAETAADMAQSAARTADCEAALSVTGVAGPDGGTPECPVGLVYIGCHLMGETVTERHVFAGDRFQVRRSATLAALSLLKKKLEEMG
ncbi:MAG: CinA family protein [Roseburia sp.]